MTKTALDIAAMAHRRLGVLAADETPDASQHELARLTLDGVLSEVQAAQGISYSWGTDAIPESLFLPLAYLVAVDMAPHYEIQPRDSRAGMIARLRTQAYPDDREPFDLNDDGTVSEAEEAARKRARYY